MAEARIHLLLDTVVRAHTQLDEQKHYCFASLDTLVKLLPIGKSKGGRRKGLRVCGLQDSSRNFQTSSVRASPRAPLASPAAQAGTQVAELVQAFSGRSSRRTQPPTATSSQGCEPSGSRDEVPEAVHNSSEGEAPKCRASSGKCRASDSRELEAVHNSSEGEAPKDRASSGKCRASGSRAVQRFSEGEPVPSEKRASPRVSQASLCAFQVAVPHFFEDEPVSPKERASSRKYRASGVPESIQQFSEGEAVAPRECASSREHVPSWSGASPRAPLASPGTQVAELVQDFSGRSSRRTQLPTATSPQGCEPRSRDEVPEAVHNSSEGEAPKGRASSGKCRASGSRELEAVERLSEGEPVPSEKRASSKDRQASLSASQVPEAVPHFSEDEVVSPKERASHRASGVPEPIQQFSKGEAVAPRECAVSPEEPASTRKRQASRTQDEVPRKGVPEPVQQFSESKSERASSRKRRASGAQDQVSDCGSPHEGAEEEVQSVKRRQTLRSWHSRASPAAGELPECGPGPVESRGQVSEPGGSLTSNLVASVRSFLPLVVQQPAVAIANGKKDVRVKALEAADAARRLEEKRLEERKRKFESLKLEKCLEQKTRLDEEKEKQRKKDEERKKKELELNAKKRKKEEVEKKEREDKRRKVIDAMRLKKEQEEKLRAELEEKEQRRKAMEEAERERKALEEEMKRQKRLEREREIERRRKADDDAKAAWLASKEAERKRREETFQRMKVLEKEQRSRGAAVLATSELPIRGTSLNLAKKSLGLDGAGEKFFGTPALRIRSCGGSRMLPVVPISDLEESDDDEPTSYDISPYKSSSEDEGEGQKQKKVKTVPRWARKENLTLHLMRQVHIDPDAIFSGAKSCSLHEVFGTTGNKKRRDFSQRSGSGDWVADLVTWKEELEYKKTMGYLQPRAG